MNTLSHHLDVVICVLPSRPSAESQTKVKFSNMPEADPPPREPLPVLPTDVWQIIALFAQPVSAAATRHLAAPARALDEHVQYKLDGNNGPKYSATPTKEIAATRFCVPSRWRSRISASVCIATTMMTS